jgi:Leucine-rich repeat (LRR) protein
MKNYPCSHTLLLLLTLLTTMVWSMEQSTTSNEGDPQLPMLHRKRVPTPSASPKATSTGKKRKRPSSSPPTVDTLLDSCAFEHVASYLDTQEFNNIMKLNGKLRTSSIFYSKKAFCIPRDATNLSVRNMITSINQVEKIEIGMNINHLTILQESGKLKHLIVTDSQDHPIDEASADLFMELLSSFTQLTTLAIRNSLIVNIEPLSRLKKLSKLGLSDNRALVDISHLADMTKLTSLNLRNTGVVEITHLSGLINLEELDLSETGIVEIESLSGMKRLTSLFLAIMIELELGGFTPLSEFTQLTKLDVSRNGFEEIPTFLPELENLIDLDFLISLFWPV